MISNSRILSGFLALLAGFSMEASAFDTSAEALTSARKKAASSDLSGALSDANDALRLSGENTNDRVNALLFKLDLAILGKDAAAIAAAQKEVTSDKAATLAQKLTALQKVSAHLKLAKKHEAQKDLYLQALKDPDVAGEGSEAKLLMALAAIYDSVRHPEKAGEYYEKAASAPNTPKVDLIAAYTGLGKMLVNQSKYDEARAAFGKILALPKTSDAEQVSAWIEIAESYQLQGEYAKAKENFLKATAIEGATPATRTRALSALALFYRQRSDIASFKQTLDSMREINKKIEYRILREYAVLAETLLKPDEAEAAWREMTADIAPTLNLPTEPFQRQLNLLANRYDKAGIKAFAEEMKGRKLLPEQQALVEIINAGALDKLSKFVAPNLDSFPTDKQAAAYYDLGKLMMRMKENDAARFFAEKAESLYAKPIERIYGCQFVEKAPVGVEAWQNSEIVKDPARRESRFEEYNKKAAGLLINDVNVAREINLGATEKESPTSFFMLADPRGLHVYLQYRDDEADLVEAGLLGGGELEVYLTPGKGEAYYQIMVGVPSGNTRFVSWSSPHKGYRPLDDYLVSEVAPIKGGFGVYLCFPWEAVYDKLPEEGDRWPFGTVDFGRKGAFVWGTGQVHELNRFGKVQFEGIEKQRPAIQRWIVMKAFAKYKAAAAQAKIIWNDREKGDTAFYNEVLAPEIAKLDELGKRVTAEMSASDTAQLFRDAVPTWMEFGYHVADLRTRYLSDKLIGE